MKYNSVDAIRQALGFKSFCCHRLYVIDHICNRSDISLNKKLYLIKTQRNTGRTTKMILDALFESQNSIVAIRGCSLDYSHYLQNQCRSMARLLALDSNQIIFSNPANAAMHVGHKLFTDHYFGN